MFTPKWFLRDDIFGTDGCAKRFPTFAQFLAYVVATFGEDGADADAHWRPHAVGCAPCLVDFDAVVKLESAEEDQVKNINIFAEGVNECKETCCRIKYLNKLVPCNFT